jgi:hypothetical protein
MALQRYFGTALASAALIGVLGASGMAQAQESTNRVAAETDWSVFVEASAERMLGRVGAQRNREHPWRPARAGAPGQYLAVFATYRGDGSAPNQLSQGGYPFAPIRLWP